jgi:hypothetical protein
MKGKDSGMTLKGQGNQSLELGKSAERPHAEDAFGKRARNQEDIKRRAYEIYQEHGSLPGREVEDWLQAESELKSAALFMRAATGEKHRP